MRHFGKMFLGALAALVLASVAVQDVSAQTRIIPDRNDQIQRSTGKLIDFGQNTTTTTHDIFDFGFTSELVRLCVRSGPIQTVYFRVGNAVTTSPTVMASAIAINRFTEPVSSSAAFITGDNVLSVNIGRALPLGTSFNTPNVGSSGTSSLMGGLSNCVEFPFRGPGIVTHIVSGVATVEAWAVGR